MIDANTAALADQPATIDGAGAYWLHERPGVWLLTSGYVDLFAVQMRDEASASAPQHLFRVEAGDAIFALGLAQGPSALALLARGSVGTRLQELPQRADDDPIAVAQFANQLDRWIGSFSQAIIHDLPPKKHQTLEPGHELALRDGEIARSEGQVRWVRLQQGSAQFLGRSDLARITDASVFPLDPQAWLEAFGETRAATDDTTTCLRSGDAWSGLAHFHALALVCLLGDLIRRTASERERLETVAAANERAVGLALTRLASILKPTAADALPSSPEQPLLSACRLVGSALGLTIVAPAAADSRQVEPLEGILRASRIRSRRVALRGEWWRQDNGPLLCFAEADKRPVALLPDTARRYLLHDPATGDRTPVTPELAATLEPFAYSFFRPFPTQAITALELLKFGLYGCRRDLIGVLLTGMAISFLALAPSIVTRVVFDSIIPGVNYFKLAQLTLALIVAAIAVAMFQFVRSVAILRIEARMSTAIQAAVWDRLLNLPVPFFRQYAAGDLAVRVNGIDTIRQILTGTTVSSILAGVFSIFNFALLFYYDTSLALLATALVLLACVLTFLASYSGLRYERRRNAIQARISGLVLQLISGMAKLRVAGAETRAFAVWAEQFTLQRRIAYSVRVIGNLLNVFNVAFPTLTTIAIFAVIAGSSSTTRSTGTVLAFIAAFAALLASALTLSSDMLSILRIVPLFENAQPILRTAPEVDTSKAHPGELTGAVEVSHVSFRYQPDGPLILDDVSISAAPGEFIAIVGPSGSGKSSLLRMLLGFETAEAGSVYYDKQDLAELDIQAVRRQIGVVLQNGKLMPGDIFTNIVGNALLTVEDAWEAARLAGLDEDIRQMPMGIHTVISEAGSTFSGGQRQRLMIARAIVAKPRILLFDEATSALDNRTQAIVSRSLERLQATRIVIAHRLSTISNADRIYVIVAGRVVQQGSYATLAEQEGPFQELIRRQI